MRIAHWFATVLVFAGAALGLASPAAADPGVIAGNYIFLQSGVPPHQWQIWPLCTPAGCKMQVSGLTPGRGPLDSKFLYGGDAVLVNGQWTFTWVFPEGFTCPDGSKASSTDKYAFDDVTLTGTHTSSHPDECGVQAGQTKNPFTLQLAGPLGRPVETYPYMCPTWPHCDEDTVIPPDGTRAPAP
jgi:hypothetical protein